MYKCSSLLFKVYWVINLQINYKSAHISLYYCVKLNILKVQVCNFLSCSRALIFSKWSVRVFKTCQRALIYAYYLHIFYLLLTLK